LLQAARGVDAVPEPVLTVLFHEFGQSSLNFSRCSISPDAPSGGGVPQRVDLRHSRGPEDAGHEIPFPQQDLHIRPGEGPRALTEPPGGTKAAETEGKEAP
jgi:small-conductance mechanosensitive channel